MRLASMAFALLLASSVVAAQEDARPSFAEFLAGLREEAAARGIRPEIVNDALGHVEEPLPVVLERDRSQAELVLPLERYIAARLKPAVVRAGQQMMARHHDLLDHVSATYGVPGSIVVAIWGVESNFGRFSGIRPTVTALATLAWDPRRARFFRGELFDALEILNRGDIELPKMRGSWAGAMGEPQFMPSSYLQYAEDFDGDGRRDIWSSTPDVLASNANYLKGHGWTPGLAWGREVTVSREAASRITEAVPRRSGTCQATRDMTESRTLTEWRTLGVRAANGRPLPASTAGASLVSGATRRFLVSANYDALLSYNCAHAYAVSVGLLADRIAAPARAARPRPPAARKRRAVR